MMLRKSLYIFAMLMFLVSCNKVDKNPNILYSEDHKDPIKELETNKPIDQEQFKYSRVYYVPIYSDIYVDSDNQKTLLSATLSIRNTSTKYPLYISRIDYYNTRGDFVRHFLEKPIKLPVLGTLNYIVEKEDDTGGSGANFVLEVQAENQHFNPVIEAVMVGHYSNKSFAFVTDGVVVNDD